MTMTTSNQPSTVDLDAMTVTRSIRIAAPLEKVWAAITEPAHIASWFSEKATLAGTEVGTTGTLTWADHGDLPFRVEEVDPQRMIAYRWNGDDASGLVADELDNDHSTVFRFTLEPVDGGTQLVVVETGFETTSDPAANLESHRGGWDSELDELVAYLESGS